MKNLAWLLICSLLCTTPVWAEEEAEEVKEAETTVPEIQDFDKQFEDSVKEMTVQLQSMTAELVKYMNTLNKSLGETMPQMTDSMSQVISSMKPVAETMQKNMDNFVNELNQQLDLPEESSEATVSDNTVLPPEQVVIPEAETQDLNNKIDKELAEINPFVPELPQKKIKLFPYTVE